MPHSLTQVQDLQQRTEECSRLVNTLVITLDNFQLAGQAVCVWIEVEPADDF